jgi:predicted N-acetyltransferase YhbS
VAAPVISHLCDLPDLVATLESWFVAEWEPWYGPAGGGDAKADLAACTSHDALPLCLVACDENGALLGTASLKGDSVGSEVGEGPWLAAVLVAAEHQGKGVGSALVAAIEEEASRLGFPAIYTSTDTAMRILERRGWRPVGATQSLRGAVTVYRLGLPA